MAQAHPLPFNTPRDWAIELGVGALTGVFLGLTGPFASYFNDDALPRVTYWSATFLGSCVIYGLLVRWTQPRAQAAGVPWWVWLPALVIVVSAPLATISRIMALSLWPFLSKVGWLEWYGQSLLITFVYTGGYVLIRFGGWRAAAAKASAPPVTGERPRISRDALCLQMEDHYVRVHTARGSDLVLMPLGQAMAELGDVEGLQTHRSWWVARRAVAGVVEDGRNLRLRLTNGLEAPVSRASVAKLRAAGWIEA